MKLKTLFVAQLISISSVFAQQSQAPKYYDIPPVRGNQLGAQLESVRISRALADEAKAKAGGGEMSDCQKARLELIERDWSEAVAALMILILRVQVELGVPYGYVCNLDKNRFEPPAAKQEKKGDPVA